MRNVRSSLPVPGVLKSGAMDELKELAEKAQIPVTNTLVGLGGFPR